MEEVYQFELMMLIEKKEKHTESKGYNDQFIHSP